MKDAYWKYIVIASLIVALGLIAFLLTESFLAACADTACKPTTAMTEMNKRPINEECVAMLLLSVDGRIRNAEYTTWQKQ